MIDLRWIQNDVTSAEKTFGPGRYTPEFSYLGAPISADFELSYENLAPFVTEVLNQTAPLEGAGLTIKLVEIQNGKVRVW